MLFRSLDWEARIAGARHRELAVRKQAELTDSEAAVQRTRENRRFHMALISGCPSQWQLRFISTLYDQSERFRRLSLSHAVERSTKPPVDEHEQIMQAAFKRDVKTASELLRLHIVHSNQQVMQTLFPNS